MVEHHTDCHSYFTHLENPQVLMLSKMHGDEYESGSILKEWLKHSCATLPSFVYIPEVSPSAAEAGTRINKYGNDINRQFLDKTTDPEALATMNLVQKNKFRLCIDVHEDKDRKLGFYLYDTGTMTADELAAYREAVQTTGARLYTGVDDVDDENLNLNVEKGYVSLGFERTGTSPGFSSHWLCEKGIATRTFTLEIPGKATQALKRSLIATVIPFLLSTDRVQ